MGWFGGDCIYSLNRKATPQSIRHDKSTTRARAGAGSLWGFMYVRGVWLPVVCPRVSAMVTNKIKIWLVRGYARDTPPPLHLLCKPDIFFLLFRLSVWLICEPLGRTGFPKEKTPAGRTNRGGNFANLWGAWGVIGFTPEGLGPMVASFFRFVNTFFTYFVIFW